MNQPSLSDVALLVHLSIKVQLRQSASNADDKRDLTNKHQCDNDALDVVNKHYPGGLLNPLLALRKTVTRELERMSDPFNKAGRLLPSVHLDKFVEWSETLQQRFTNCCQQIVDNIGGYDALIEHCRLKRNGMFDRSDYPAGEYQFVNCVRVRVGFNPLPTENNITVKTVDHLLEHIREVAKIDTEEQLQASKRHVLRQLVDVIRESIDSMTRKEKFKQDSIDRLAKAAARAKASNTVHQDPDLERALDELAEIGSIDADILRKSKSAKTETLNKIDQLANRFARL